MKKHLYFVYLAIVSLTWISCSKEENNNCDPEGDCFSAIVAGEQFNSDNVSGQTIFNTITISASLTGADAKSFGVTLAQHQVGTYDFTTQSEVTVFYSVTTGVGIPDTKLYAAKSGSLTIEQHNEASKIIEGTLEFEGETGNGETIQITDGYFKVKYQ